MTLEEYKQVIGLDYKIFTDNQRMIVEIFTVEEILAIADYKHTAFIDRLVSGACEYHDEMLDTSDVLQTLSKSFVDSMHKLAFSSTTDFGGAVASLLKGYVINDLRDMTAVLLRYTVQQIAKEIIVVADRTAVLRAEKAQEALQMMDERKRMDEYNGT